MICPTGKFSFLEQAWMQMSFNGIVILGAIAISAANIGLAIGYVAFVLFGIVYCVMHLWICPRCPHILQHNACVQAPPWLTKLIIRKNVSSPLGPVAKVANYFFLYGVVLLPVYWVMRAPAWLYGPYLIFAIMHYPAYYLHFCKRCLNVQCPHRLLTVRRT